MVSAVSGLAAAELHGDRTSVPVTVTELVSGWSRAAFRGLTELKRTAERQPVKPREAGRESSGSSSGSGERGTERDREHDVDLNMLHSYRNSFSACERHVLCWF